jgi:hypothetical protein
MVTVEADVEIEDYLDEVPLEVLREEIARRQKRDGDAKATVGEVEVWTPSGLADDLRNAFYARNASRFEALLTVLQPHENTPGLKRAKVTA